MRSISANRANKSRVGDPAEDALEKSCVGNSLHDFAGAARDDELHDLHANALGRQHRESFALADRRVETGTVERSLAIGSMETKEAQDAQIIFADALSRIADEAHAPRFEIGQSANRIMHDAIGAETDSAFRVKSRRSASASQVAAEPHVGVAADPSRRPRAGS